MNIPQEFVDVFHGVELTEDEIRTLTWIASALGLAVCLTKLLYLTGRI